MQKFSFKLEAVLRHKQWLEDEAKRMLGIELHKLDALIKTLRDIQNEHRLLLQQRANTPGLTPRQHLFFISYSHKLLQDIAGQKQRIEAQDMVVKQKTEELNTAVMERKKLDKLKERDFQGYRVVKKRKETLITDENSSNFIRRVRESR